VHQVQDLHTLLVVLALNVFALQIAVA
jgi:hypothetical protein